MKKKLEEKEVRMRKIKTHCREEKKNKKNFTDDIDINQRVQFMERDGECERMFEKLHHHNISREAST